jgi:surface protein
VAFCLLAVFCGAPAFNEDLSAWDVSAVTNMQTSAPTTAENRDLLGKKGHPFL